MIEKLHLALPGDPVSGSMTIKNLIMLHEHRDVIVKLDFPKNASFRLVCREEPFYSPVKKKQCTEFTFSAGEEVHIWLSKFHMRKIMIERLTSEGWNDHGFIDPRQDDGADYSPLAARPAPIILRFGLPNSPIGSTVKIPKAEATIPPEYLMELKRCHQSAADASSAGQSLLRLWETDKFPSLSREEGMRECHAYPQEPEYCCLVEIRPETELYRRLLYKESIVRLASPNDARLVADALVTTLGQVADKAVLIRELRGLQPRFIIRTIGGVEKKFIVIPGYSGLRRFLTASAYGVANAKVVTITAGKMSIGQLAAQAGRGIRDTLAPGITRKVLIVGLLLDTVQWLAEGDLEAEGLLAKWTTTLLATGITAGLLPFITAGFGGAAMLIGAPAFALVFTVGGVVVFVTYEIGRILRALDVEDNIYILYKRLRAAWVSDLALIGYDDFVK